MMVDYEDAKLVQLTIEQAEDLERSKKGYTSVEAFILALQSNEHIGPLQYVPLGRSIKALFWGYELMLDNHSIEITTSTREVLLNAYEDMTLVNGSADRDGRAGFKKALDTLGIQVGGINAELNYPR